MTFIKRSNQPTNTFYEEAAGLAALARVGKIRVVRVIAADDRSIELEKIESETPTEEFWVRFGRELAEFHSVTADHYGFEIDNHIGATPQPNPKISLNQENWADYFVERRLKYLLNNPRLSSHKELHTLMSRAEDKIHKCLEEVTEKPCLLHGDLWSGNFLCTAGQNSEGQNSEGQIPVLIDPAPYYGHREADLAMTELFGGFAPEFYESYDKHLPLQPGYQDRKHIYNLYHVLNHWILFGDGYANQALSLLERTINLR